MACYADKVVATAIGEIGYKEKGNNVTKYASYFDKNYPNFYNTAKQGAEWCDIFVDYCVLVNSDNEAEAERVLCQPKKSCGAGCSFSYNYYKEEGRAGKTPKYGAQIFFGSSKPTHTGIVVEVKEDSVVTVEGNSDNEVKKHTYKKTSTKIFGYGYPRYTEAAAEPAPAPQPEPAPAPTPAPTPTKSVDEVAKEVIDGKWGTGEERKKKLADAGYNYTEVQNRVNELLKTPSKPSTPAQPVGKKYTVKVNSVLNVRKGPGTNYTKVGTLKNGTSVTVYETKNGFGRIGDNRWVAMSYLK